MTIRHPDTCRLDVPFTMYATPEDAIKSVNDAGRQRDWQRTANILAEDERVLWTIEEDHIELWYRTPFSDAPITEGV